MPTSFFAWELGALVVTTVVIAAWFAGPIFGLVATGFALLVAFAAWQSSRPLERSASRSQ